jgi:hypothetical protein
MGVGGQRHAAAALPPGRPGTHCVGGWVGPRAGLNGCGKSRRHRDSIPGPCKLGIGLVFQPYEQLKLKELCS